MIESDRNPTSQRGERAWAILPAAGRSRRMGQAKLLLPWGEGVLVDGVVAAWQTAGVDAVVGVVHPEDSQLADHLRGRSVHVVVPDHPPPDMKESVRIALQYVQRHWQPVDTDRWLLAPADMPTLSPAVICRVVAAGRANPGKIVLPAHAGRHGHPASFPWTLAAAVALLAENEGVNAIVAGGDPLLIECGAAALPADVDTPGDYRRLRDA